MAFKLKYYNADLFNDDTNFKLYHFTSSEIHSKILSTKSLRFYKNNFSNDPNEGKIIDYIDSAFDLIERELSTDEMKYFIPFRSLIVSYFQIEGKHIGYETNNNSIYFPSYYVFCSTLQNYNRLLWDRYADNYNGKCIEFNRDDLDYWINCDEIKNNKYVGALSAKVIYNRNQIINLMKEFIKNGYLDYLHYFDVDKEYSKNIILELEMDILLLRIFIKDEKWSYEQEVRFVLIHTANNQSPLPDEINKPFILIDFRYGDGAYFSKMFLKNNYSFNEIEKDL